MKLVVASLTVDPAKAAAFEAAFAQQAASVAKGEVGTLLYHLVKSRKSAGKVCALAPVLATVLLSYYALTSMSQLACRTSMSRTRTGVCVSMQRLTTASDGCSLSDCSARSFFGIRVSRG